jgi:hypothetical protein
VTEPTSPSSPAPAIPPGSTPAPAPSPAGNGGPPSGTPQAVLTRPEWVPEAAWDAKAGLNHEAFGKHYSDAIAPKLTAWAAEEVRRAALPPKADDYRVGTSPAFKVPEGLEFKLDDADPLWPQAKQWAHKHGLSQDAFLEAVDLVAARDVGNNQAIKTARDAEIAKLGPNGPARLDAVTQWWTSVTGDDGKALGTILRMAPTASTVQALEKLVSKFTTQGAASFSAAHREPPEAPGRVSDAQYNAMTPGERFAYARQFPQNGAR